MVALSAQGNARHCLLVVALLAAGGAPDGPEDDSLSAPAAQHTRYVGSQACRECHADFYDLWASSRHARSVRCVDAGFIAEHLRSPARPVEVKDQRWQVRLQADGAALLRLADAAETPAEEHEICLAVGGADTYFFLTLLRSGRWQVLPLAYDTRSGTWQPTTAGMLQVHEGAESAPVDWMDPAFNWNARCMDCHVSQSQRRYAADTNRYDTRWLEDGINCETCHGPGARHVELMRASKNTGEAQPVELVRPRLLSPERADALCASCHALAAPLTRAFRPGDALADHYHLVGLESDDFSPDGQSRGETYTYTSFLLSKCVSAGGLACSYCHTPSGRLRWTGTDADRMCTSCHSAVADAAAEHTHHSPGGEASRCSACHMPQRSLAGSRRCEHSMLPPAPRLSVELQVPNACNGCHAEKDAAWVERWVRKWYPRDYQTPLLQRARLIAAAREQRWERLPEITRFIADPAHNEVFRWSLIRLLRRYPGDEHWPVLLALLNDPSVWVRAAAAEALARSPRPAARDALAAVADDEYRAVRLQAAFGLSGHRLHGLSEERRAAVACAFGEFEALAADRADEPAWQVNAGVFYQNRGDLARAAAAYEQALAVQSTYQAALVNLSLVYAGQGRTTDAERVLLEAARADPTDAAAHFNLGLLYGQINRLDDAEKALRRALSVDPQHAGACFNLAVLLGRDGRYDEALAFSRNAAALRPDEPRYHEAVSYFEAKVRAGQ